MKVQSSYWICGTGGIFTSLQLPLEIFFIIQDAQKNDKAHWLQELQHWPLLKPSTASLPVIDSSLMKHRILCAETNTLLLEPEVRGWIVSLRLNLVLYFRYDQRQRKQHHSLKKNSGYRLSMRLWLAQICFFCELLLLFYFWPVNSRQQKFGRRQNTERNNRIELLIIDALLSVI